MQTTSTVPTAETWGRYWSNLIVTIIATVQLVLSLIAVGLHSGILYIEIYIFCASVSSKHVMGYICWVFFIASWIAGYCITCCNRSSFCCATYGLAQNLLAFIFSAVLIDYCRKFLDDGFNPFSSSSASQCTDSLTNDIVSQLDTLTSLHKSLLAVAVLILLSTLAFAGIYIYTLTRACLSNRTSNNPTPSYPNGSAPTAYYDIYGNLRPYVGPMTQEIPPNAIPYNHPYQQNPAFYKNQQVLGDKYR
ncbi:unnamed protein product [Rotaria magnacalcarata]|uniref:Uncharacterized protein n=1 Tax=Rotaria magnacalcarata TaxID=392030 RepID=A0A816QD30_9BILA|nr:unnamed protein product [Rotaria magnacalcarata]CAF1665438.1 unnamed protein product [Rotaria magnacalcarata]CAF2060185.1 unnamed protein product [Rotaria magnacalcarata]